MTSICLSRRLSTSAARVMAMAIAVGALPSAERANGVTVSPGGSNAIGILFVPDFLPNPDDVLEIEFQGVTTQGVDYDYIEAANFALLDGKVEFKQLNLFTPTIGQSFNFLEGLQVQFEFNSVSWPNAAPGVALELDYPMNPLNGVVGVEFFAPQMLSYTGVVGSWNDLALWNPPAPPTLRSNVELRNTLPGTSRTVDVDTNHAFSYAVEISAVKTSSMTLNIDQNHNLSATHGLTIMAGGVLAGTGKLVGNGTNTGGTVSPGVPSSSVPSTMTIDGRYDQGAAGTLEIDLRGSSSDLLSVTGDVTLGGTLDISLAGTPPPLGLEIPILQTTGGIRAGVFEEYDASPGLGAFRVRYDNQGVYLTNWTQFDMDLNMQVDADDIDEFLLALVSPDAYLQFKDVSPGPIGDADGDLKVDFDDIVPFEQALAASGVFVSIIELLPVPEPASWCHQLIAMLAVLLHLRRGRDSVRVASKSNDC